MKILLIILAGVTGVGAIADASNTQFILVLTPLLREFKRGQQTRNNRGETAYKS